MADSLIQSEGNQTSDERAALLNKWKDKAPEEVLNAKIESDLYIKSLTTRFDDLSKDYLRLREEHQASADLKTLIETLKKERQNPDTTTNTPVDTTQPAIKPEELKTLMRQELVEYQNTQKQQENFRLAQAKLKEAFGENYVNAYKTRLDQLGLAPEVADDMAKNHPQLFAKTFDLDVKPTQPAVLPRSTQRQATFTTPNQKRDWNYYQELKKSNPKLYLDPKIAIQMHNDAIELGAAFGMPED